MKVQPTWARIMLKTTTTQKFHQMYTFAFKVSYFHLFHLFYLEPSKTYWSKVTFGFCWTRKSVRLWIYSWSFLYASSFRRGATCYLNSLIQVMYMTPELRDGIFSIDPNELGLNLV